MSGRVAGLMVGAVLLAGCATAPVASDDGLSSTIPTASVPAPALPTPTTAPSTSVSEAAACPESGIRITSGGADAAMGLRVLTVFATNCGATDVDLTGHPEATVTGEVTAVVAVPGGEQITDPGPTPILLAPGDQACAVLSWRLLVESGDVVAADEFSLAPLPGLPAQPVAEPVDLGTTGRWFTTAWYQGQLPELAGPCGTAVS